MDENTGLSHKEVRQFMKEGQLKVPFAVKLKKPIEFGDTFEEIKIEREPTAGDYELMPTERQVFSDHYRVVSKMIGQPVSLINKLTGPDAKVLMEVSNYFFSGSGGTGEET